MSGDGFGNATRGDAEQIGRSTDGDSVIADAERLCAGDADQVEGDLQPAIASEVAFPTDNRRSFQQVTGPGASRGACSVVRVGGIRTG
jgi:hypothetical protein